MIEIAIEEMPQGCIIHNNKRSIIISNPEDAIAVINSLLKMLRIQFPEVEIVNAPWELTLR